MKTGTITFNVTHRGRQHRGQDRNFDTAALARIINGGETQERVKNRDLVGYFGHWPRTVFGMDPREGGLHDGKQITLEPALITTKLVALPDGTIEHEAEFLDTAPGRTAKRLFSSKAGGFSSAISCRESGGRDVPISFHGFDYVMEPNFTTNRGYALDGVGDASLVMDDALRESMSTLKVLDGLYSTLQADYERQADVLARALAENAELVAMLSRRPEEQQAAMRAQLARLDSADGFAVGLIRRVPTKGSLATIAEQFDSVTDLPGFEAPESQEATDVRQTRNLVQATLHRLGIAW